MMPQHLDKRMELIKKIDIDREYEPTDNELQEAYGYLDNCLICGKRFSFLEPRSHGFEGNCHKFGCTSWLRFIGMVYSLIKLIVLFPLILIGIMIYPFIIIKRILSGEHCGGW